MSSVLAGVAVESPETGIRCASCGVAQSTGHAAPSGACVFAPRAPARAPAWTGRVAPPSTKLQDLVSPNARPLARSARPRCLTQINRLTEDFPMRISIFGLGYVGCVTAACLAKCGHEVFGVDVNPDKVAMINAGKSPIIEPGLGELISDMVKSHHLRATVSVDQAIRHSHMAMICVGTPSGRNGQIDTSAVEGVFKDIARAIERRTDHFRIIVRSTLLPGTTENMLMPILRTWLGEDFAEK